jgi:hypothetical protein
MHTRQRTRESGGTLMAPKALAPKALAAERPWEGSESRLPEWGSVAGSPGRRAAEAAIHSPFQPEGEKLFGEGDGARRKRQAV